MLETNYRKVFHDLMRIQWENYIKGTVNIVLGWLVTVATLISWLAFKKISIESGNGQSTIIGYDEFVLASGIGISTVRVCMYNVYRNVYFFRKSTTFQRFFATPLSKSFLMMCIVLFNMLVNLAVTIFLFGIGMCFAPERARLANINWELFISGYFILVIMCILVAFIFGFWIKINSKHFEVLIVVISVSYFTAIYFLGLGIPFSLIFRSDVPSLWFAKAIYYINFINIVKYPLNIMQAGWVNATSMKYLIPNGVSMWTNDVFGYGYRLWVPYVVSFGICIILIVLLKVAFRKQFEIGIKKYKRLYILKTHLLNISAIKKSASLEELTATMKSIRGKKYSPKNISHDETGEAVKNGKQ